MKNGLATGIYTDENESLFCLALGLIVAIFAIGHLADIICIGDNLCNVVVGAALVVGRNLKIEKFGELKEYRGRQRHCIYFRSAKFQNRETKRNIPSRVDAAWYLYPDYPYILIFSNSDKNLDLYRKVLGMEVKVKYPEG